MNATRMVEITANNTQYYEKHNVNEVSLLEQ